MAVPLHRHALLILVDGGKMATPTNQEMLDAVKIAIQAILSGGAIQSYSINNRNLQRMSLSELQKMRRDLEKAIAAESGTGRNYIQFNKPT